MWKRTYRGLSSALPIATIPLGSWWLPQFRLLQPERLDRGLVIILPGIEGRSVLNYSIGWGLLDAGCQYAIEVDDWTTGYKLPPIHLCWLERNQRQAARIAGRIEDYRTSYPGRPVHLMGHSGGGGITLLTLEALSHPHSVTSAILFAPAVSPSMNLSTALSRVEQNITHFHSPLDVFLLGIGTMLLGTIDRKYGLSAGNTGFEFPRDADASVKQLYQERLIQHRFTPDMIRHWNLGGHFGCVNRVFVHDRIAPLILEKAHESSQINAKQCDQPTEATKQAHSPQVVV